MFFLVDNKYKIIFGWSAKCGCSHVKRIFNFFTTNKIDGIIHTGKEMHKLPDDIINYTTIIISRNPYKRLISGFLDKYSINGQFRCFWKYKFITFSRFIDELVKNDWKMIEHHHFTPQTTEGFDEKILLSKCIKCYDIENIDYNYIEELYNIKIPEILLNKKEGHERKQNKLSYNNYVYDLRMMVYYDFNVDIKYFYNENLKNKVFNFYKNDFDFFKKLGFDYI
jgi:hypothetical protein